jgi:serine/threonine-protein kinase
VADAPETVGRYVIERLIAHGGMGSVYLARDPAIDRLVVIKLLRAGFDDDASRERFAREARAAGRLHHPNIVTVFDVGEHDHRPFIAMEYVPGETLAHFIRRRAASRLTQKLLLVEELCAGLHYAHVAGVIHRDVKPANVMHSHEGLVKILDFGIARTGAPSLTRQGDVAGTLNYMSPEQLLGEQVDHRTDIYAVGLVAYELITNHMAFPGSIDTGVLHRILQADSVPVASLEPAIDSDLDAIVRRAMAREREGRYEDLEVMARDLADVRVRLAASDEDEEEADPSAETRVDSGRMALTTPRPSSRSSSIKPQPARSIASAPPPASVRSLTPKLMLLLGTASVAALATIGVALLVDRSPEIGTPPAGNKVPGLATPPVSLPSGPPTPSAPQQQARPEPPTPAGDSKKIGGRDLRPPAVAASKSERVSSQPPPAPPPPTPAGAATAVLPKPESPPNRAASEPAVAAPPPLVTATPTAPQTSTLARPLEPKAASPGATHAAPPDRRAVDESAIRETLSRYEQAYESLNSGAVGALIPSLSPAQLRDLGRDFANYRRYTVDIRSEHIVINDETATVTCQVLRSFETKSGVEGNNVVPSTFHMRRAGTSWAIERVEASNRRE